MNAYILSVWVGDAWDIHSVYYFHRDALASAKGLGIPEAYYKIEFFVVRGG